MSYEDGWIDETKSYPFFSLFSLLSSLFSLLSPLSSLLSPLFSFSVSFYLLSFWPKDKKDKI